MIKRRIIFPPRRIQHVPGEMNATERAYSRELQMLQLAGDIEAFAFEPVTFTLAHNVKGGRNASTYTPDFMILIADGEGRRIEFHDVKAFYKKQGRPGIEGDALEKMKFAAESFPDFLFVAVWNERGEWKRREF